MTNPDETNATASATPAAAPKPASIHDTFFYKIFSNPELAAAELKSILPAEVSAKFDWDSLRVDPNRFVDGNLGNHIADILLSAQVRGKKTYVHLLFEHSSGPKTHGKLVINTFFVYMIKVAKVSQAEIRMALQDTLEPILDPDIAAIWERYEAAKLKGELDGELRGELKALRKMLKRQLGQRFGVLAPHAIARIDGASVGDLEAMELRVLTAATLEEALGKPGDHAS